MQTIIRWLFSLGPLEALVLVLAGILVFKRIVSLKDDIREGRKLYEMKRSW